MKDGKQQIKAAEKAITEAAETVKLALQKGIPVQRAVGLAYNEIYLARAAGFQWKTIMETFHLHEVRTQKNNQLIKQDHLRVAFTKIKNDHETNEVKNTLANERITDAAEKEKEAKAREDFKRVLRGNKLRDNAARK